MFEFLEQFNFGRVIKAHGKEWQSLKDFGNGYHIAILKETKLPCQVFCVRVDEEKKEDSGNEKNK